MGGNRSCLRGVFKDYKDYVGVYKVYMGSKEFFKGVFRDYRDYVGVYEVYIGII